MKQVFKILRAVLQRHNHYYFDNIKWKIIEGQGFFDYSLYFPEIKDNQKNLFNRAAYLFFKKKQVRR
jgi:hypothetical protein